MAKGGYAFEFGMMESVLTRACRVTRDDPVILVCTECENVQSRSGGQMEVWSQTGSGTEVELNLPASKAYVDRAGRLSALFQRLADKFYRKETAMKS